MSCLLIVCLFVHRSNHVNSHSTRRGDTYSIPQHSNNHTTSSSSPPSSHSPSSLAHNTSSVNARQSANDISNNSVSSQHAPQQPWRQPFAAEYLQQHSHAHRLASLPPAHDARRSDNININSNLPLNLSVSSAAAQAQQEASLPRSTVVTQTTPGGAMSRGEHSASPGVPEKVAERRVMTHNGMMHYSTPLHGASLPNMEAKTHRDVDSGN